MNDVIVATTGGRVRGTDRDGIVAFLGIPYASGALGEFRFRAPGPAPRWDGVRAAVSPGPTAPQSVGSRALPGVDISPFLGGWVRGDDFLTVNVWTPDPGAGGLPVMVFLHGGAFVSGAGSLDLYDGGRFARRGVVLVTVTYRLGAEGFLPLPGGDTNVGVRDQLAALRWVRDNVAAFGGDPGQVTVFGESAGATSIACLLGSPAARGLFARAIIQSGNTQAHGREYGVRLAAAMAGLLGVPATKADFARLEPADLVAAQLRLAREPSLIDLAGLPETRTATAVAQFGLTSDADVVPDAPLDAVAGGAGVDVLAGTNTDEMNLWMVPTGVTASVTEGALRQLVTSVRGHPDALVAAYQTAHPGAGPGQVFAAIMTDGFFRRPTLQLLDRHATAGGRCFCYEFTHRSPALAGALGACHLVELPYVFGNLDADGLRGASGLLGDQPPRMLAERVQEAWVRFASTGDPGWKRYTPKERLVMRIGAGWGMAADPFGPFREAWRASGSIPRHAPEEPEEEV